MQPIPVAIFLLVSDAPFLTVLKMLL